ncbi:TPA: DapH/DapD/GlmU-related protein [Streptococcus agalactiae]
MDREWLLGALWLTPETPVVLKVSDRAKVSIGKNCEMRAFSTLEVAPGAELVLGERVFFNDQCTIVVHQKVTIGQDTLFGFGVRILDFDHRFSNYHIEKNNFKTEPISIGANCWIGSNVVILKGVTIGDNVIIGAGCVISKDVPSDTIVTQKRELLYRDRSQKPYHAFIWTGSGDIEHLVFLAEKLPNIEFHVAAPTSVWQGLYDLNQRDNITIYPNIDKPGIRTSLLERADIYLDINHGPELDNIIVEALEQGKPVFAFDNVAHRKGEGITVFPAGFPQDMTKAIEKYLDGDKM